MSDGIGEGMMAVVDNVGQVRKWPVKKPLPPGYRRVKRQIVQPKPQGKVVQTYPYYSQVRFPLTIVTAGGAVTPSVYRLASGYTVRAFGYGIGDDIAVAGLSGVANELNTNLVNKQQTNSGQNVRIAGISVYIPQDSDAMLAKVLSEMVSITLGMNGEENKFRLGRLGFLPSAGGLMGSGQSSLVRPGTYENWTPINFFSNGLPGRENYYPLPMNVYWNKAGSADSTLVIIAQMMKELTFSVDPRAAGSPDSGVEPWIPPQVAGELGTYLDLVFRLHTVQVSNRSVNL